MHRGHEFHLLDLRLEKLQRGRVGAFRALDRKFQRSDFVRMLLPAQILIVLSDVATLNSGKHRGGSLLARADFPEPGESGIENLRNATAQVRLEREKVIGNVMDHLIRSRGGGGFVVGENRGLSAGLDQDCGWSQWLPVPVAGEAVDIMAIEKDRAIEIVFLEVTPQRFLACAAGNRIENRGDS